MVEQKVSVMCLGPTSNFQGSYKIFSLKIRRVVTHTEKIQEIPMPTWFIQRVGALAMRDGRYLAGGDEPLFVDCFANKNDFADALHEGGITGVT